MFQPQNLPKARHEREIQRIEASDCSAARCPTRSCPDDRVTGRPTSSICARCFQRLRSDLHALLELYGECGNALTRSPSGLRERVRGTRPVGIDLDDDVMVMRTAIMEFFSSWTRLVMDERRTSRPARHEIPSLADFLIHHLRWLSTHPAIQDLDLELGDLLDSARRLVEPGAGSRVPVGRCPRAGCSGMLHAITSTASAPGSQPVHVRCDSGHVLPPQQWLLVAEQLRRSATG